MLPRRLIKTVVIGEERFSHPSVFQGETVVLTEKYLFMVKTLGFVKEN